MAVRPFAASALVLLLSTAAGAQGAPPSTEIFVADLVRSGERWQAVRTRNVTHRPGYDNQPYFLPDGVRLLYTSFRDGQTDIYEIDLAAAAERQITATPESEYSPQSTLDGKGVVVVRVEPDGTQRLWRFPGEGGAPALVAPEVRGVGYQAWIDAERVAVFVLGEPFTLQLVGVATSSARVVAEKIGRSMHRLPGSRRISFVAPDGEAAAIFAFDADSGTTERLAPAPGTAENDYAWTPDGTLLAARGAKLLRLRPGVDADWSEFADLTGEGITSITRLAVSPIGDKLAFVVDSKVP